jgi:hypothetical protein
MTRNNRTTVEDSRGVVFSVPSGRQTRKAFQAQERAKREARLAEANEIVSGGKCPTCGAGLRRNNSMAGWWQCEQLGAEGFRKDATKPSCNFQTFTE